MIKIISIHLPKTGGSSFLKALEDNYGKENVLKYNRNNNISIKQNKKELNLALKDKNITVLHGHLYYRDIKHLVTPETKIITWFRDPIKRYISNYRWFINTIHIGINNSELHRKDETIFEYVKNKRNGNKMTKFLKGLKLEKLFFIGYLDYYDSHIKKIADKLNWKVCNVHHEKDSSTFKIKKQEVPEEAIELIKKRNKKDIKLFDLFLKNYLQK